MFPSMKLRLVAGIEVHPEQFHRVDLRLTLDLLQLTAERDRLQIPIGDLLLLLRLTLLNTA